jgi:hypothetical protein
MIDFRSNLKEQERVPLGQVHSPERKRALREGFGSIRHGEVTSERLWRTCSRIAARIHHMA